MKLDEMDLLVRVADTGSMTMAARQLRMTPAAISAAVKRVEEVIGVRLFDRTTRSIQPTDEGVAVLDGCRDVVRRWQRTLEEVSGASGELSGTVHISAPTDTTYQVIAPVIVSLSDEHPQLRVVVHPTDSLQHLHRDAIDIAIRYGALPDSELMARKLADCPVVLVASPEYVSENEPIEAPSDLALHRTITLQLASVPVTTWELHGRGAQERVELDSPLCSDGYLARRWAIDGNGIALKSLFDVVDDLEAGRLVRVLPEHASEPMPIHVVFPSRRYLPARVRALDSVLAAAFESRSARCKAWLEQTNSG